ncbi:MAG TPA: peptidoglycan DD-metalloendopeptidase family protein [Polyangia bacterium]|nr:peptidoglycan DD-metalloendopeptidase family protein [Polyangia bacterium]
MKGVGAGIGPADGPVSDATGVYQQMEATFLRQLLSASGAFKPADVAGGQLRADMFIEAMADAVAKGGGIGIARLLQDSLGDAGKAPQAQALQSSDETLSAEVLAEAEAPDREGGAPRARAPSLIHARPGFGALAPPSTGSIAPTPTPTPTPTATATGRRQGAGSGLPVGLPNQVTSPFGHRPDPIDGHDKFHPGIDLRAAAGDPIRAAGEGVVRRTGPRGGYGNAVEVDHGGGVTTLYAHASEVLVSPGEKVAAQQEIGRVGQTGRATGPHLHFEVRLDDRQVDPTRYAGVVHRALNAYQQRAEAIVTGQSATRRGDGP